MAHEPINIDYDYKKINNIIHSRIRLAIMSILTRVGDISFNDLKKVLQATDGNLSSHLSKLESIEYIEISKTLRDNKPETRYRITKKGLSAFANYIIDLENFIG